MNKHGQLVKLKNFVENNSESKLLARNITVFLKSYYLNVHVVAILKKHLRNLKIITNVNVKYANRQKRHDNV